MLTPEQNHRLQKLFDRAVDLPAEEQSAFLVEHVSDDEVLLAELRDLLAVDRSGTDSFLAAPCLTKLSLGLDDEAGLTQAPYDAVDCMLPWSGKGSGAKADVAASRLDPAAFGDLTKQKLYRLHGEVSRGGMGVVLRGEDNEFGRPVAIKVMRRELLDSPYLVHRFVEEARINGRLQHPGIVPVYDMGLRADELPYFSMKLIEGRTLAELLDERPSAIELLGIFEQICQAIAYAHHRGVVHRDLKPSNVMVGAFGEVHVLDWGVAKVLDRPDAEGNAEQMHRMAGEANLVDREDLRSQSGSVIGTLPYMPPEQARGDIDAIGPPADVFALGAVLCQLLTGRPAYVGSASELYQSAREGNLASAFEALAASDADAELVALVTRCLHVDPAKRPADGSVVAGCVGDYLRSLEQRRRQAEIETAEARVMVAQERRARRLTLALGTVVGAVLLVGGLGITWWNGQQLERQARVATAVAASLDDASRSLAEKRYEQALWSATAAQDQLQSEDATVALRERCQPRMDGIAGEARLALDNARLLLEIESIRMPERGSPGAANYLPTDWVAVDAAYGERFIAIGVDLDEGTEQQAAERMARRNATEELAPILDEWSVLRVWAGREEASQRLLRIANLVDQDERRRELRNAIRSGDTDTLMRYATGADVGEQSSSTLSLLSHALQYGKQRETSIAVLRVGCRRYRSNFSMHMNLARTLMLHGDGYAEEATRHYLAASALRPDNLEAKHELGRTLHMFLGENEQAIEIFRDALAQEPDDAHLTYHLGYALAKLGRDAEAIQVFQRALQLDPKDSGSLNSLGVIYAKQRERKKAIDAYRAAVDAEPGSLAPILNLGLELMGSGQFEEAIAVFQRALEVDPACADAYSSLGIIAMKQERHDDALTFFNRAIAIDNKNPKLFTNQGQAFSWKGQVDNAFAAYERALQLDPDFVPAHYNLGILNMNQGRGPAAEKSLEECIRCDRHYLDAYRALAGMYWIKDWPKVASVSERAIEANPSEVDFCHYLAEARKQLGQHGLAVEAFRAVIAREHRRSELLEAHKNLGTQLTLMTRYAEAHEVLLKARELSGDKETKDLTRAIASTREYAEKVRPVEQIIAREVQSADPAQLLAAARVAHARLQHTECSRLYATAREISAAAVASASTERVEAIHSALLAAAQAGEAAEGLSGQDCTQQLTWASQWLHDLSDAVGDASSLDAPAKQWLYSVLSDLEQSEATAGIREEAKLVALPEARRAAWQAMWRDMASLRARLKP